jgi:hypothetical protein
MAAQMWVNDAGTPRQIIEVWVNDSGVARRINEIWVNDSGTARQVFAGGTVQSFSGSRTASTTSDFYLQSNAERSNLDSEVGTNYWLVPQSGMGNFDVFATVLSGSLTTGTTGSWLNLGTTRTWSVDHAGGPGSTSVTLQLQFRRSSDGTIVATNTVGIVATS